MKKVFEKLLVIFIHLFCLVVIVEIGVNYFAFRYLFPTKNATSYGYVAKHFAKTIIQLNKYPTRLSAQLSLPYEIARTCAISNIKLIKDFNKETSKFGFINSKGELKIDYQFDKVSDFYDDNFAIAGIKKDNKILYGTIDKNGKWIIGPKYEFLCPFSRYHTKACTDNMHCGVIDKYGNEITLMTYNINRLQCDDEKCAVQFCSIGQKDKENTCNYFL